jgi:hypothetical protein
LRLIKAPLPQALADHRNGCGARFFFVVSECTPGNRRKAEHPHQRRTDQISIKLLRIARASKRVGVETNGGDFPKRILLLAP